MIILLTTLHTKCNPARAEEYKTCLHKNLNNPYIDEVKVLLESSTEDNYGFLEDFQHEKLKIQIIQERPYYADLFACANEYGDGHIALVCNGDIYFDENSNLQSAVNIPPNEFWTLSRYNESSDGGWKLFERAYTGSHDCWIFRTLIRPFQANYHLGIIGCDLIIAQRAVEAGFKVVNPCLSVYSFHIHRVNIRNHFLDKKGLTYSNDEEFMRLGQKLYCAPPSTLESPIVCSNTNSQYLFMHFIGRWFLPFYRSSFFRRLISN